MKEKVYRVTYMIQAYVRAENEDNAIDIAAIHPYDEFTFIDAKVEQDDIFNDFICINDNKQLLITF